MPPIGWGRQVYGYPCPLYEGFESAILLLLIVPAPGLPDIQRDTRPLKVWQSLPKRDSTLVTDFPLNERSITFYLIRILLDGEVSLYFFRQADPNQKIIYRVSGCWSLR